MYPFIHLFGKTIASYYVCAALAGIVGFLLAAHMLGRLNKKENKDLPSGGRSPCLWCFLLPAAMEVLAVIGARLLNVVLNPDVYKKGFSVFSISYRQLSLMGGLILGLLGILLFCAIWKKDPRKILDAFTIPCATGIVILKIGCFLNGCCAGKKTDLPWGMVFPGNDAQMKAQDILRLFYSGPVKVHPTQLYEILGALIALTLALLLQKKAGPGGMAAVFAGTFSIARWIVLPYRVLSYPKYIIHIVYPILYGMITLLCLGYAVWSTGAFRKEKNTPAVAE